MASYKKINDRQSWNMRVNILHWSYGMDVPLTFRERLLMPLPPRLYKSTCPLHLCIPTSITKPTLKMSTNCGKFDAKYMWYFQILANRNFRQRRNGNEILSKKNANDPIQSLYYCNSYSHSLQCDCIRWKNLSFL